MKTHLQTMPKMLEYLSLQYLLSLVEVMINWNIKLLHKWDHKLKAQTTKCDFDINMYTGDAQTVIWQWRQSGE